MCDAHTQGMELGEDWLWVGGLPPDVSPVKTEEGKTEKEDG